jgi:hypothetical protein
MVTHYSENTPFSLPTSFSISILPQVIFLYSLPIVRMLATLGVLILHLPPLPYLKEGREHVRRPVGKLLE